MDSVFDKGNQKELTPVWISAREAFALLMKNAAIVDIRPEYETNYRVFDVPRVYYLPYGSYRNRFEVIPKDMPLIIADNVGLKSGEIACFLMAQGYPWVMCLAGGVVEWNHDGLPLAKDLNYELIGSCACRLHPKNIEIKGSKVGPK